MLEAAKIFWEHVQNDIPVAALASDDETLAALYPEPDLTFVELFPEDERSAEACIAFEEKVKYLQELKLHISEMDKEKKR